MARPDLRAMTAFATVAACKSFTRAAAQLGVSQPTLSRTIGALEREIGVPLLSRTTRNVGLTAAGERLLRTLRPALDAIEAELGLIGATRDAPSGVVRLTMTRHVAEVCIQPRLNGFLRKHPAVDVEINASDALEDVVAGRFDGGVRLGDQVDQDMAAVRVGPDVAVAVVASPAYLDLHGVPRSPKALADQSCINYRQAGDGGLYAWAFQEDERRFHVRVTGRLTFNDGHLIRAAAIEGSGIAYMFEDQVRDALDDGRLVRLLQDWSPVRTGYHLYYPDRRQKSPAMAALVDTLRS